MGLKLILLGADIWSLSPSHNFSGLFLHLYIHQSSLRWIKNDNQLTIFFFFLNDN